MQEFWIEMQEFLILIWSEMVSLYERVESSIWMQVEFSILILIVKEAEFSISMEVENETGSRRGI